MIDTISKNLWLLLTLVLPGFFTYGLWRLGLFFVNANPLSSEVLKQIDESTLTTTSIIFAFALMQQAVAIAFESLFNHLGKHQRNRSKFRILFCDRFELVTKNKLNEHAERMIGNFFLSFNMSIGICLIIGYFLIIVGFFNSEKVLFGLILLLTAAVLATVFRMRIAEEVISDCKKES